MKIRNDIRVYYCLHCRKTFSVTDEEYKEQYKKYLDLIKRDKENKGIWFIRAFELNGHARWIYRYDENYEGVE